MTQFVFSKMADRQVGRNAELFAQAIGKIESQEQRLPYLRILVSIIEQAHPEWVNSPRKHSQICTLVSEMEGVDLRSEEIAEAIKLRDAERSGSQN